MSQIPQFNWSEEFIVLDGRNRKPSGRQSYSISKEFFTARHSTTLPPEILQDANVLDLGSYLGASSQWCSHHGCRKYTGIEIVPKYAAISRRLLSKYCSASWDIRECEIQGYLSTTTETYDVIIAWGILNTFTDPIAMIEKLLLMAPYVLIDVPIPHVIINNNLDDTRTAVVEINPYSSMAMEDFDSAATFQGSRTSLGAIELIAKRFGFGMSLHAYNSLKETFPNIYGPKSECSRAMAVLTKTSEIGVKTYRDLYV